MSVVRQVGGRYRVQIRRKNLQFDKTFETEAEAKQMEKRLLAAPVLQAEGVTLAALCERYQGSLQFKQKAEHTKATEKTRIKPVLEKLGGYSLGALEKETHLIYDYIDQRGQAKSSKTGRPLSNSSVRLEVAALSAVIAFAKNRQLVRENFVANISRPVTKRRKRRVSNLEQGALQRYARSSDFLLATASRFLLLIRHLGCRPGELASLKVADVKLNLRHLTFRDTKNGQDRLAHITSDAQQMLQLQIDDLDANCPYVFATWSKKQNIWRPYNYAYGVKKLRSKEVIPADYAAHAGRREFISRAIESSVSFGTIKKQTGHKSTQALEIYDEGLSTAPEIRSVWDALAEKVRGENLLGTLESMCTTDEQRKKNAQLFGTSEWVSAFPSS